jgi:hypothetical protein
VTSVATAMLCKEQGITITGICAIYEIFLAQKVSGSYNNSLRLNFFEILYESQIKSSLA